MDTFSVTNWEKHQHYKDRNPPWIKLHKDLLHDYGFSCLRDASKVQLMMIWLLASQMDNKIPADQKWLKNALHLEGDIDLKALSDAGFIDIASTTLAGSQQSATTETEAETQVLTEAKAKREKKEEVISIFEFWKNTMNHSRSKLDDNRKKIIKKALDTGYTVEDCEHAILGCKANPWNMGGNENNQVYDSLDLILRNAEKIDKFIANYEAPPNPTTGHQKDKGDIMAWVHGEKEEKLIN
jgi:hypothetical protein